MTFESLKEMFFRARIVKIRAVCFITRRCITGPEMMMSTSTAHPMITCPTAAAKISANAHAVLWSLFDVARDSNGLRWGLGVDRSTAAAQGETHRGRLDMLSADFVDTWLRAIAPLHPDRVGYWGHARCGHDLISALNAYTYCDISVLTADKYGMLRSCALSYLHRPDRLQCVIADANAERRAVARAADFVFDVCAVELERASDARRAAGYWGYDAATTTVQYRAGDVFTWGPPAADFDYQRYFDWSDAAMAESFARVSTGSQPKGGP
jgi:hypothetical protein